SPMFGYLIVSGKNEVLLASGDDPFQEYVHRRLEKEVYFHHWTSVESASFSSSSGVYTDSEPSSSSSPLSPRAKLKTIGKQKSIVEELPAIGHLFMPLISTYRASEQQKDAFERISIGESHVRFHALESGSVLISMASEESPDQLAFIDYLKVQLRIRFGPLQELMNSGLSSVEDGYRAIERLTESFHDGAKYHVNGTIDCRTTASSLPHLNRMNDVLKSICDQLQIFIGSNRCFLMHGRDVVFTVNSSSSKRPVSKQLCVEDLNAVLDSLAPLAPGAPAEISQFWIRSSQSGLPFFVDVIRCKLTPTLDLLCLSESKSNALIRTIMLFIDALDKICDPDADVVAIMKKLDENVDIVSRLLVEMVFDRPHPSTVTSSYLRNPVKTANYFRSLWQRLYQDLSHDFEQPIGNERKPFLYNIKSTFSMLSLSTFGSTFTMNSVRRTAVPTSTNALTTYMHKQIINLLQEIVTDVKRNASKYKLSLFLTSMEKIYRQRQEAQLRKKSETDIFNEDVIKFSPSELRLDMEAYSIATEEHRLDFSYMPGEFSSIIRSSSLPANHNFACTDVEGPEGKQYRVIQWRPPAKTPSKMSSLFRAPTTKPSSTVITAVFSPYVHRQLSMLQVQKLATTLEPIVSNCASFYN
ncbi:hypothetical protein PENTCL1PPCAC_27925, partial [Pristionchus entomophagus]